MFFLAKAIANERSSAMSVYNITFSPTGGTKKAADLFVSSFCPKSVCIDLTDPCADFSAFSFHEEVSASYLSPPTVDWFLPSPYRDYRRCAETA